MEYIRNEGPWILTASGKQYHYGKNDPSQFDIEDIAEALSRLCRFNGHLKYEFNGIYSVAQHCVYVYRYLLMTGASPESFYWGLMHDAPESYWSDVPGPLKSLLTEYVAMEDNC